MNLLESMMERCVILNKTSVPDGMGGFWYEWVDGAEFEATIIKMSAPSIVVAEQQGISEMYNVVARSGIPLSFHDVFKRLSDGATFRVTDDARDTQAPQASTIQIAKVTAERWEIPS